MAPSIAGFYGVYTALNPGFYSMSYNVRYSHQQPVPESGFAIASKEDVWVNLQNELDPEYKPFQSYFLELLLGDYDYSQVIEKLKT